MCNEPPPPSPEYFTPTISPLNILTQSIILGSDKLFFISTSIGLNDSREWRLDQVAFQESMSSYPFCLQDGCFLVDVCICHPTHSCYNAVNQCILLSSTNTLLICPSDSSDDYATRHKLLPFQKWLNLTHHDTFIQDPFDFACIKGCKTRDPLNQTGIFSNPL
jgi:hypothetical protein